MKITTLIFIPAVLFLFACGNEKTKNNSESAINDTIAKSDTINTDTIPKTATAILLGADTIEPSDASLILYRFNELLIKEEIKTLSVKEVRKRFMPLDPDCNGQSANTLQRFFDLDSMNRAGDHSYNDLGQTVKVEIRVIDTIPVSSEFTTVAWTMYYSTYEACPFSAGTYFMISTYDKNSKLISTQQMGMKNGGGDAPMSFTGLEIGNLYRDGSFKILHVDTSEDSDAPPQTRYEIFRKLFRGSIGKDGKIVREEMELKK